jgi:hypothetical protein
MTAGIVLLLEESCVRIADLLFTEGEFIVGVGKNEEEVEV